MFIELSSVCLYELLIVEYEHHNIQIRNKELTQSMEDLRNQVLLKDKELSSLNNDLLIVTKQNKSFSQEIERLTQLSNRMKVDLNTMRNTHQESSSIQRVKDQEIQDILEQYRACTGENQRLKQQVDVLKQSETALYTQLKSQEQALHGMSAQTSAYAGKQKQLLSELATLQQHIQYLNRELEANQSKMNEFTQLNQKMVMENKTIRHATQHLESSTEGIYMQLSENEAQSVIYSTNLRNTYPKKIGC